MSLDWTKPIQTRDGRSAALLGAINADNAFTHVVRITGDDGFDYVGARTVDGRFTSELEESGNDIVNAPEPLSHCVTKLLTAIDRHRDLYYRNSSYPGYELAKVFDAANEVRARLAQEEK